MDIYKEKITMKTFRLHTIIVKCAEKLNRLSGKGELRKERNSGFLSSLLSFPFPASTFCHHHHRQSLFIHEIVSFYMVFLRIVFKTRLKCSKELLTTTLKIQKLTLWIIRVTMGHGVLEKTFPWIEVLKTFKLASFLISEGILFHRTDPL